jgi:hypothetical protein
VFFYYFFNFFVTNGKRCWYAAASGGDMVLHAYVHVLYEVFAFGTCVMYVCTVLKSTATASDLLNLLNFHNCVVRAKQYALRGLRSVRGLAVTAAAAVVLHVNVIADAAAAVSGTHNCEKRNNSNLHKHFHICNSSKQQQ